MGRKEKSQKNNKFEPHNLMKAAKVLSLLLNLFLSALFNASLMSLEDTMMLRVIKQKKEDE